MKNICSTEEHESPETMVYHLSQGIGTLRSASSVQGAFRIIVTHAKSVDDRTAVDIFEKGGGTAVREGYWNTGIGNELDCSGQSTEYEQKGKDKLPLHLETIHIDGTFRVQEGLRVREPNDDGVFPNGGGRLPRVVQLERSSIVAAISPFSRAGQQLTHDEGCLLCGVPRESAG